ncbi:unnamed protein product [Bursaphelenchus okinawaensis]|uniref:DH domain-containing protein n=1 Tax=Bursaphelenchus okinawaensis TaxID=465554 RepID=A0A811LR45_9BILA|nr:unnamed protein product [Bursaphelenchus okinawaensis]CAG9127982.1 unnamed protein product [Bursaphelenchus okinawaensis]
MSHQRLKASGYMTHNIPTVLEESGEDNLDLDMKRKVCVVGLMPSYGSIVLNILNKMNCDVVYSETGVDYMKEPGVTFLCWRFDDPIFTTLCSADCLILGPTLILQCAGDPQLPLIEKRRPVYTQSLRGMRFVMSGFQNDQVKRCVDMIHFMSGSARQKLTQKEVLIATSVTCSKYLEATTINSTILSFEFIEYCWSRKDDEDFQAREVIDRFRLKCFVGLTICFVDFYDREAEEMKRLARENGAIVVGPASDATHYVYRTEKSLAECRGCYPDHGKHVLIEWFHRSIKLGCCAAENIVPMTNSISNHTTLTDRTLTPTQQNGRRRALNTIPDPSNSPMPSGATPSTSAASFAYVTNSSHSKSSLDNLENSTSGLLDRSADQLDGGGLPKTKRFKVFCELLDTEQNYVDVLHLILMNFKKPLENQLPDLASRRLMNNMFSRIEPLYHVHCAILSSLKALAGPNFREWKEEKLIGQVYATPKKDLLERYVSYMNVYDQIKISLDELMKDPTAAPLIRDLERCPECKKCSLRDLLIRPVQRLPSVVLLLKALKKATDKSLSDYKWLEVAISSVDEVLTQSNLRRQQTDVMIKSMECVNEIEGIPAQYVQASREFVRKIDLIVLGAGGLLSKYKGKMLTFFLFTDTVLVAKNRVGTHRDSTTSLAMSSSAQNLNNTSHSHLNMSMSMMGNRSTLGRTSSFLGSIRHPPKKPFRYVDGLMFMAFRLFLATQDKGVFFIKIRDQKADEFCAFQVAGETDVREATTFFNDLVHLINANTTRNVSIHNALEVLDKNEGCFLDTEDMEFMRKTLNNAHTETGNPLQRSQSQLRRAVSSVSVQLQRMTSRSRFNESVSALPR